LLVARRVREHFCTHMKINAFGVIFLSFAVLALGGAAGAAEAETAAQPVVPTVAKGEATPPAAPRPSAAVHDLLLRAIREQRVLRFTYRGLARVVEPHAYGRNSRDDAVLHAFQTEGGSASRPPPGWRTFSAGLIEAPSLGEQTFAHARDGYSPNELRLDPLWAEVPALMVVE
jgi:hypothetical protein